MIQVIKRRILQIHHAIQDDVRAGRLPSRRRTHIRGDMEGLALNDAGLKVHPVIQSDDGPMVPEQMVT